MTEPADIFSQLSTPPLGLTARGFGSSGHLWLAVDEAGLRHVLIEHPDGTAGELLFAVRGLSARVANLSVESGPLATWVDVVCSEPAFADVFGQVAEDLVAGVRQDDVSGSVRGVLETWRRFWLTGQKLDIDSALGLFGELWFWDLWLYELPVEAWQGPLGHWHDFATTHVSVEVKSTLSRADALPIHEIANLQQLADPDQGALFLFSLQLAPDDTAGNSLDKLVRRRRSALGISPAALLEFDERLKRLGWEPVMERMPWPTYRVIREAVYRVTSGFPRLTPADFPAGLPPGVSHLRYSVDMLSAAPFLVDENMAAAVQQIRNLWT